MPDTFEQFSARARNSEMLAGLRSVQHSRHAAKFERFLLQCAERGKTRMTLAAFAEANQRHEFVATVAGRGFNGRRRTIILKDLRPFGVKFVFEDHLWVPYDKKWERLEPFFQGLKVVLVGTAVEYTRSDGTVDYTLALERVTTLKSN